MSRGTYVNTLTHRNELISMYAENQIFYARRKKNLQKANNKSMRFLVTKFIVI